MNSFAGEENSNAAEKRADRAETTHDSNDELDDTLENIEEKISDDEGKREGIQLNPGEETAFMHPSVPYQSGKLVIKSVLSREASGGSTDSKKNKRVTFHPSVEDSDQEVNEYATEYDYPDCDDDVYEADDFQEEAGDGDKVMVYDGSEED